LLLREVDILSAGCSAAPWERGVPGVGALAAPQTASLPIRAALAPLVLDKPGVSRVAVTMRAADLESKGVKEGFGEVKLATFDEKRRRGCVSHREGKERRVKGPRLIRLREVGGLLRLYEKIRPLISFYP
jgi:hypothetical protein